MPERIYNDPAGGSASTIGAQLRTDIYNKVALQEAAKEMYFGQLSDTISMPKHMGKKIKKYHYLPLLDDANINDQGIDAAGVTTTRSVTISVTHISGAIVDGGAGINEAGHEGKRFFVGEGANAAAAEDAAVLAFNTWAEQLKVAGGLEVSLVGGNEDDRFVDAVNVSDGLVYDLGYRFAQPNGTAITAAGGALEAQSVSAHGNLYGSSKDVGTIAGKLPALSETGGRVNRVGFKRIELEGTIAKFGFFDEYTKESLDFDTDAELEQHITREMIMGANEMTEDALQIDLLNAAGVVRFGGIATQDSDITGVTADTVSVIDYNDLMRLSIDLDNNRTPKQTKIITGTRMIDTKVIDAARIMYIGSELIPMIRKMVDNFGNQAFVPVAQYGAATTILRGEIGSVDQFRIVVVPEMMHFSGAGASEGTNAGYRATGGKYDVFPMLVVGGGSFVTIGFQTDGKTVKFKIKHVKPESDGSYSAHNDPYGEIGFMSIKWYYGTMILRSERIALCKTVAEF